MEAGVFALLCGLSSVCLCACIKQFRAVFYCLAGFSISLAVFSWNYLQIEPMQFSFVIMLVAFFQLKNPARSSPALFFAGLIAGLWIRVIFLQGLPFSLAFFFVLGFCGITLYLSLNRKSFISPILQEETMSMIFILALGLAVVPELATGWQAAINLQEIDDGKNSANPALSVILILFFFTLLGILYSRWKRR